MSTVKRAFLALEDAERRLAASEARGREPIAVIGLGCRTPGADAPEALWQLLLEGRDAIAETPAARWDHAALYDPEPGKPGRISTRYGGFLDAIDGFDAGHFGLSAREAAGMDPQQRLLLEVAWEALEHAAQAPDRLSGSATGVYVGAAGADYAYMQLQTGDPDLLNPHFASGIAHSALAGRLSYLLGLQGPSLTVDTACSSSLVAVHLACQALRAQECRMAVAGGVNLILSPDIFIALSQARMLSPDGRCKAFSAQADGFGRAEGCALVVLKRLADARADGDRVLAVIRGGAVNQDGPSSGLTAPNGPAQEAVITAALERAGVAPETVGYLEAHGTGTALGDPIEAGALQSVFGGPGRSAPLRIGSVKSNLGHLEAAAGVTGLIKLVLALHHRRLPPSLHAQPPNPLIDWSSGLLEVPSEVCDWAPISGRWIAGVSSFGFSGTNAHLVVEAAETAEGAEADVDAASPVARVPQLLALSASGSQQALQAAAARHAAAVGGAGLADYARTVNAGRAQLALRAAVIARDPAEASAALAALAEGKTAQGLRVGDQPRHDAPRVAFLFTGQGAQYAGMGRGLHDSEPVVRATLERCAATLDPLLSRPLAEILFDTGRALRATGEAQPALFALEYALAELWKSWGVVPDIVLGHSLGEFVAATVAGVFELDDALRLVAARGRLMQALPAGGAMASLAMPEHEVAALLGAEFAELAGSVAIAAVNSETQTVISGAAEAVRRVAGAVAEAGGAVHPLDVSHAFHSPLMDPALAAFEEVAAGVVMRPPGIRLLSNVTGRSAGKDIASPGYWHAHARAPVRFADCLQALAAMQPGLVIEIGPQPILAPLARRAVGAAPVTASLCKGTDDREAMLGALGAAFLAGADIDWRAVADPQARIVDAPTYPFQRKRHWFSARPRRQTAGRALGHPLLGHKLNLGLSDRVVFEQSVAAADFGFIADHVVGGQTLVPGAALIELAVSAGAAALGQPQGLRDCVLAEPLALAGDSARILHVVVRRDGRTPSFEIRSAEAESDSWLTHAEGSYAELREAVAAVPLAPPEATERVTAEAHYRSLAERGLTFGPALRRLQHVDRAPKGGVAVGIIDGSAVEAGFLVDPAVLDACLQVVAAALPAGLAPDARFIPFTVEQVAIHRSPGARLEVQARVERAGDALRAELSLHDEAGPVATITGLGLRPARRLSANAFYQVEWQLLDAETALAIPDDLAQRLEGALDALAEAHKLSSYTAANPALDAAAGSAIRAALGHLGWRPRRGESVTPEALAAHLSIAPRFHGLLRRYLEILAEDRLLQGQGNAWTVATECGEGGAGGDAPLLVPGGQTRAALLHACAKNLPDILRGHRNPLEELFPKGDVTALRGLYRDAPEARVFNGLIARAVRAVADSATAARPLRVLEVGAGSGGTTAAVLDALEGVPFEYLFSDVSPSLVREGEALFGSSGALGYAVIDLEAGAADEPFGGGGFDLVIAANCVHATRDLRATLRRLRASLAPGGSLVLLETTAKERWVDLTFGLTEGWWHFADSDLRADYPLLSVAGWLEVLDATGFEAAPLHAPQPGSSQCVLLARRTEAPEDAERVALLVGEASGDLVDTVVAAVRAAGHTSVVATGGGASGDEAARDACEGAGLIVDLRPLGLNAGSGDPGPVLASMLGTVQTLARSAATPARLVAVTQGAQAVEGVDRVVPPAAAVWGFMRALDEELPELTPRVIDLDPGAEPDAQAALLVTALMARDGESQLALRGGRRFAARLAHRDPSAEPAAVRLVKAPSGVLEEMALEPAARRLPGPGEVEIRVRAAGLNLRDVLNALDMRDDPEPLGSECVGRVVRVGPGVTGIRPGTSVVAIAEGSFATYAVARQQEVATLPDGMSDVDAATLPFAYMTALRALRDDGGLRAGDRVLIHAAAGGVGSAAMALALAAGAEVFATAGTPAKRALLRERGARHVFSSRDTRFADEILRATDGAGVDLALNSLAGPMIEATVSCLAPQGRLLEIGKRDILSPDAFRRLRPGGAYHIVDLAALRHAAPEVADALFQETVAAAAEGRLPPLPSVTLPLARGSEGFVHMARARHVGKIVLTSPDTELSDLANLRPDASYLVTGGLGGLGLRTASHLAARGARHLVLVGRGAPDRASAAEIEALRSAGIAVATEQMDIGDPEAVRELIGRLAEADAPLRGVIHAAGALSDAAVANMSDTELAVPMRAKVHGSWALHQHTAGLPLDMFVLYSSVAGTLGSRGQVNHAAANAYMDALAEHRRALGLPATSIAWGAWSGVGVAAAQAVDRRLSARGVEGISPEAGIDLLETALASGWSSAVACPINWAAFLEHRADRTVPRFFERVARGVAGGVACGVAGGRDRPAATAKSSAGAVDFAGLPDGRRRERLIDFVTEQVAETLDAGDAAGIDAERPLRELGLDSLMAVDLRNRLAACLPPGQALPATLVFDHPTVTALAAHLDARLVPPAPAPAQAAVRGDDMPAQEDDFESMSEEEIEARFAAQTGGRT